MSFIPLDSSHPLSGSPFETTSVSHPSALTHRFTQSLTVSRPPPSLSLSHSLPAPLSRSASGLRRSRRTLSRSAVAVAVSRQPLGLPVCSVLEHYFDIFAISLICQAPNFVIFRIQTAEELIGVSCGKSK